MSAGSLSARESVFGISDQSRREMGGAPAGRSVNAQSLEAPD